MYNVYNICTMCTIYVLFPAVADVDCSIDVEPSHTMFV